MWASNFKYISDQVQITADERIERKFYQPSSARKEKKIRKNEWGSNVRKFLHTKYWSKKIFTRSWKQQFRHWMQLINIVRGITMCRSGDGYGASRNINLLAIFWLRLRTNFSCFKAPHNSIQTHGKWLLKIYTWLWMIANAFPIKQCIRNYAWTLLIFKLWSRCGRFLHARKQMWMYSSRFLIRYCRSLCPGSSFGREFYEVIHMSVTGRIVHWRHYSFCTK